MVTLNCGTFIEELFHCMNGMLLCLSNRIVTVPITLPGQTTMLCHAAIIRHVLKMTSVQMVSALERYSHVFHVKSVTMTHAK